MYTHTMPQPGTNSADIFVVATEDLPSLWPQIAYVIETTPGGIGDTYTLDELYWLALSDDNVRIWIGLDNGTIDLVGVTEFERHVKKTSLHITGLSGTNMHKYFPSKLAKLEQYACMYEVDDVVFTTRKAFKRLMKPYGYTQDRVTLSKSVKVLWSN